MPPDDVIAQTNDGVAPADDVIVPPDDGVVSPDDVNVPQDGDVVRASYGADDGVEERAR